MAQTKIAKALPYGIQFVRRLKIHTFMYRRIYQTLVVLFVLLPHTIFAQHKYFVYKYNTHFGLTNVEGTELIEGKFTSHSDKITDYALFTAEDKKQVLINLETGKKDVFDEFEGNSIFLDNQYFANVENQGQHFLWSQKSGEKLPMPKALQKLSFQNVYMINKDFLYAISYEIVYPPIPKEKPVQKGKNTNKPPTITPPRKIEAPKQVTYTYIFKNERNMPLIAKIAVDDDKLFGGKQPTSVFTFYKLKKTPKSDKQGDEMQVFSASRSNWNSALKPWHFYYDAPFDVVCIPIEDSIRILDGNFNILKTIASADKYDRDIVEDYFKAQYPNDEVELGYADFSAPISMGGSAKKPFWQISNTESLFEVSYLQEDVYIPYLQLQAAEARIGYDNGLYLKDKDNNELMIQLSKKRDQLPVPLKYKKQFSIQEL